MKKLNNKGYMLVEIIMAFAITFGLLYFMMDLVLNIKNKNDDLLVETVVRTDQTIITNGLMEYIIENVENDADAERFCNNIKTDGNAIKYNGNVIDVVDDYASVTDLGNDKCKVDNGKISILIPIDVKQMEDEEFDVIINYRYENIEINTCSNIILTSYSCANITVGSNYAFTYTGNCTVIDDGDGNWRVKFLTSGDFKPNANMCIDAFLVGGGGGGGSWEGGGGGGGLTTTTFANLKSGTTYAIDIGEGGEGSCGIHDGSVECGVIGDSGESTYAFGSMAAGGTGGTRFAGGTGGSGGGVNNNGTLGVGGSDGSNGQSSSGAGTGGSGQGTTTREFGESTGDLYAGGGSAGYKVVLNGGSGGGGAGGSYGVGGDGVANTGGGGGGGGSLQDGAPGGAGGSGIVVIRNTRLDSFVTSQLPGVKFAFTYTGYYAVVSEGSGNWKIKFLTSGTFKSSSALSTNVFLVGGGGGGGAQGSSNSAGGGGGKTKTGDASIDADTSYTITVGAGGAGAISGNGETGGTSSAFGLSAAGGTGGQGYTIGGSGGSGGGNPTDSTTRSGNGGSDGSNGEGTGGTGQGTTTREFGSSSATLYAGGGGGGWKIGSTGGAGGGGMGGGYFDGMAGVPNSGGGGGGRGEINGYVGGDGGTGIVIIRNAR